MSKPISIKRKSRRMRKSVIGQIVLLFLSVEVLCFSSLTGINLPIATASNLTNYLVAKSQTLAELLPEKWQSKIIEAMPPLAMPKKEIRKSVYVPDIPVAIFLAYILGYPLAVITTSTFVLLGLVGPMFKLNLLANGGGLTYYTQPGFGYLVGLIFASLAVSQITANYRTSFRQLAALLLGLIIVHSTGLICLFSNCIVVNLFEAPYANFTWQQWVFQFARNLSWYALPYDFFFGLILIGIGFPFRWLVDMLTAPDISLVSKNNRLNQQSMGK